jgi:hypothetical protein
MEHHSPHCGLAYFAPTAIRCGYYARIFRYVNSSWLTFLLADMETPMKTTVELPDALFKQAQRYAEAHRITMRALIEQALRNAIAEQGKAAPFKLHDGSFQGGNGLTPEFQNASWAQLRDAAYEDRGG